MNADNIEFRYSIPGAGQGDLLGQGDPNDSLGGYMAVTELPSNVVHALFDAVTPSENNAHKVEYRCLFVTNTHPTDTWYSAKLWLSNEVVGGADLFVGLDAAGIVQGDAVTAQAFEATNEEDVPVGVVFTQPTTSSRLSVGSIGAGEAVAIWLRREALGGAPKHLDGATIQFSGEISG